MEPSVSRTVEDEHQDLEKDELRAAFEGLDEVDGELSAAYKELDQRIVQMDAILEGLDRRVYAATEIDRYETEDDGEHVTLLCYQKLRRQWMLVVDSYAERWEDDPRAHTEKPLIEASVDVKAQAVRHFKHLVVAMAKAYKQRAQAVRDAIVDADRQLETVHDLLVPKTK